MTRIEAEQEVRRLLAERERLARLHLDLPPRDRLLLQRLLYRLGYKTGANQMARLPRRVLRYAKERPTYPEIVHHAAAVLDNPMDDTVMRAFADHLAERHGDDPLTQQFIEWINGTGNFAAMADSLKPLPHVGHLTEGGSSFTLQPLRTYNAVEGQPIYRRAFGQPHWRAATIKNGSASPFGRRKVGTPEVANGVLGHSGVAGLIGAVIAARYYHPDRARPSGSPRYDQVNFRRPRRLAKADKTRAIAHPLVHGFPVEHSLRHLANDPKNSDTLRQTALVALTGKNHDGTIAPEGHPEAFWALHDLLQDPDHNASGQPHPLAKAYNWMSAADKVVLDAKTHAALKELSNESKVGVPVEHHNRWEYSPEAHAIFAIHAIDNAHATFPQWARQRNNEVYRRLRNRTKELAPYADDKSVHESIRRHGHRAHYLLDKQSGVPLVNHEHDALTPVHELADKTERATRYARPKRVLRNRLKMTLFPKRYAEPVGLVGGPVEMRPKHTPGVPGSTLREAINAGLIESRLRPVLANDRITHHTQDQTAGGALADALDEAGDPHAPFYRNLAGEVSASGLSTPEGYYRELFNNPHPARAAVGGLGGGGWLLRPATGGPGKPGAVIVHKTAPSGANNLHISHSAVLNAPALREWANHPKVSEQLRNALNTAAAHLEANHPQQMKRKYALQHRNDFLDALRRSRSKQMLALKQAAKDVAARLGFAHASTAAGLHDGPAGSTPGIATALYGGTPEQAHALASWNGLMGNMPGVAVFHTRPTGPDTLYRLRFSGSGHALRQKLDRAGITQRVLIPHRSGMDVLVPDPGSRLGASVQQLAKFSGIAPQVSKGYFKAIGSTDGGEARAGYRDTITASERRPMNRNLVDKVFPVKYRTFGSNPRRYSMDTDALREALRSSPHDETARKILADAIDEEAGTETVAGKHLRKFPIRVHPDGTPIIPGDRVVTVARHGAATTGRYPIFTTAIYTAMPLRDGRLTWRRTGSHGPTTSGAAPSGPMIRRAQEFAESQGLRYLPGIRHGQIAGQEPAPPQMEAAFTDRL